jgi:hypothetical protein
MLAFSIALAVNPLSAGWIAWGLWCKGNSRGIICCCDQRLGRGFVVEYSDVHTVNPDKFS